MALFSYLAVILIFRRLRGGVLPTVRAATALGMAGAIYFGGLAFIYPCVPVLDSFDRPDSIEDVKDPQKLLGLLQSHHAAVVQTIEIQESIAHTLSLVCMIAGFSGIAFLWRMRSAQREVEYFRERGHQDADDQPHPPL